MQLRQMIIYPIQFCHGITYSRAYASRQGLLHDREWLVTTPDGKCLTPRECPQLPQLQTDLIPGGVLLKAPGQPSIMVMSTVYHTPRLCTQENVTLSGYHGDPRVDDWFSKWLGKDCQLVWHRNPAPPPLAPQHMPRPPACTSPFILVSKASLKAISQHKGQPDTPRLPNLVIDGVPPFAENAWQTLQIGNAVFDVIQPEASDTTSAIDHATDIVSSQQEPAPTPLHDSQPAQSLNIGIALIARNEGLLHTGDLVKILAEHVRR
ncbi:MAG TPA: MOSC N-terminal beta barrel domain-containing protein [Chromobacteriaceae bacterium]|nr:MOSC N-terminal beta barrel domain-containing protein [Chromobacteriaceae bacterium]